MNMYIGVWISWYHDTYNIKDARESIKLIDSSAIILPVFPTNNIQFQLLHNHDSKPLYEDILDLYITKSPAAVH